jgi:hypothetical protein
MSAFITPIDFMGTTTTNPTTGGISNVVDVSSTAGLQIGQAVYAANIPIEPVTVIASIDPGVSITLNQVPNALATDIPLAAYPDTIIKGPDGALATGIAGTIGATNAATNVTTINFSSSIAKYGLAPGQFLVDTTGNASGATIPAGATILTVSSNSITYTSSPPGAAKAGTKVTLTFFTTYPAPVASPAPVVATSKNLPYTLSVQPVTTALTTVLPGIQGADYVQTGPITIAGTSYADLWLVFGGRTDGLHNFSTSGVADFPPDFENLDLFVINPANYQVLAEVPWSDTDVPAFSTTPGAPSYESLISVAQQSYTSAGNLYTVGGYGAPISAVFTGTTSKGSPNITVTGGDFNDLAVGESIALSDSLATSSPIPQTSDLGTTILPTIIAIDEATDTITLNVNATATSSSVGLTAFSVYSGDTVSFTGTTIKNSTTVNVSSIAGLFVGQSITGGTASGIPAGTTISAIGTNSITLSAPATATNTTAVPLVAFLTSYTTFDTLTSINVDGLVGDLLTSQFNNIGSNIQQITNPVFTDTGGEMDVLDGVTYLVMGQDFEGGYAVVPPAAPVTQTYTDQIDSFVISSPADPLGISDLQVLFDPVNLRRRDGNLATPTIADGTDGLTAFGGVFTVPAQEGFGNPILIGASDDSTLTATVNTGYSQFFSGYTTGNFGLYDSSTGSMFNVFLGGIGGYSYQNGTLLGPNTDLPFIDNVTSFETNASGTDQEYIMSPIPSVPPVNTGFYGAEAAFFTAPALLTQTYSNGVLNLNSLLSLNVPIVVGYMYGGIASTGPDGPLHRPEPDRELLSELPDPAVGRDGGEPERLSGHADHRPDPGIYRVIHAGVGALPRPAHQGRALSRPAARRGAGLSAPLAACPAHVRANRHHLGPRRCLGPSCSAGPPKTRIFFRARHDSSFSSSGFVFIFVSRGVPPQMK